MHSFCDNLSRNSCILNTAWEIENAAEKLARSKKTRLELLQEAKEKECMEGCGGLWKICAEEILANNLVPLQVFHDAVCDTLIKGRGKYRNIMITGNANCGKTFLLKCYCQKKPGNSKRSKSAVYLHVFTV